METFILTKEPNGDIKGGKAFRKAWDAMEAGRYVITLAKYKKKRSLRQNAYYHAAVVPVVLDGLVANGFKKHDLSNELVHELLKNKFLKYDIANENGEFVTFTKSTKELTTTEFLDYIAEIQQWAAEALNIYVPDPGEQIDLGF